MTKNTKHYRDFNYEDQVLHSIRTLRDGGRLSSRDRVLLDSAVASRRQMNMLHFADAEALVDWTTYCHNVELDEYWHNENREAWRKVWKLMWEKLVRVVKLGKDPLDGPSNRGKKREVLQYDLDGNLIKRWSSGRKASLALGVASPNISMCCMGVVGRCGQWVFRYADEGKEAADA